MVRVPYLPPEAAAAGALPATSTWALSTRPAATSPGRRAGARSQRFSSWSQLISLFGRGWNDPMRDDADSAVDDHGNLITVSDPRCLLGHAQKKRRRT